MKKRVIPAVKVAIQVNKMRIIIDRFEGEFALCETENGKILNVPAELFLNAHEGDVFEISFNETETKKRKENVSKRLKNLFDR